jgi:wobble nucleotide-excising tRNase
MLKKFIALKNIGRFRDCKPAGDVELRRLTLIFAPNGHGKTTLCDVLRSLQSGRPEYIQGRKTLGGTGDPEALIRLDSTTATFKGTTWSSTLPEISIFDSTFIHDNVHSGDFIDRDHKRRLYHVVVGQQGVQLANQVAALDTEIKSTTKNISDLEDRLRRHLPVGMELKPFLTLTCPVDIDEKLAATATELEGASRAAEVSGKAKLATVPVPAFPEDLPALLSRELGELSSDAEARVRDHLATHTKGATEKWVAEGLEVIRDGMCPFCESPLSRIDLIGVYRSYFGQSYRALKADISAVGVTIDKALGEATLLGVQGALATNSALVEFWKQFVPLGDLKIDFEHAIKKPVMDLRAAASDLLKKKEQRPFDRVELPQSFDSAKLAFVAAEEKLAAYNSWVTKANQTISAKKAEIGASDVSAVKQMVQQLQAAKKRAEPDTDKTCVEYTEAGARKKFLEGQKKVAKDALDKYTATIFSTYQTKINELLDKFGTGFRLTNTARSYAGGTASSDYQLVINDISVGLGGPDTPIDETSFRNTLSSGDRTTLALAFFLAQLDLDPSSAEKVVVLDDPFTSQDRSRRTCTQQLIRRRAQASKQVILLSHDPDFLKGVWEGCSDMATVKTLQCARAGDNTLINEWDIRLETLTPYMNDLRQLREFQETGKGDRRGVVRCIRPVLEGNVRLRFHMELADNEWLGTLITKIRAAAPGDALAGAQPALPELEDINDYCKKYHHQQNPLGVAGADAEPIDEGELGAFVKRTLAFVTS